MIQECEIRLFRRRRRRRRIEGILELKS